MNQTENYERKRLDAIARNEADATPILKELEAVGLKVDSVADLFNRKMDYRRAIPILTSWLHKISNANVKQDLIRALSVKWAKQSAPLLVVEFERAYDPKGTGLRWAIGNALEVLASDKIADQMIRLATDRRYGRAREMVVLGLGRLKNDERVVDVLLALLDDKDVAGHAVMALGRLGAQRAKQPLERFAQDERQWVRREAEKALRKLKT
ncbi:MAG: HEAT repeat domain-containing protein [Myxococcota bacterium]